MSEEDAKMEAAKKELREKRNAAPAARGFDEAFAALQSELPTVPKCKDGYNYKYAPYEKIWELCAPVLFKHGFAIRHRCESTGGQPRVVTEVVHAQTCGRISSEYPIGAEKVGKDQDFGKSLTYGKRYNTVLLLGLSIEGEPDADDAPAAKKQPAHPVSSSPF